MYSRCMCTEAGVLIAVTTDHPVALIRYLPLCAGLAVKEGLPMEVFTKTLYTIIDGEIIYNGMKDEEEVSVAKYKCSVCGYIFEETEGKKFGDLKQCPVCKQPASVFVRIEKEEKGGAGGYGGYLRAPQSQKISGQHRCGD